MKTSPTFLLVLLDWLQRLLRNWQMQALQFWRTPALVSIPHSFHQTLFIPESLRVDASRGTPRTPASSDRPALPEGMDPEEIALESSSYHTPVLFEETMMALKPGEHARILDGTLGGGGHTSGLLQRGAEVIALDRDPEAIAEARARCEPWLDRLVTVQANFGSFSEVLTEAGVTPLDGILLDIGISSHQIDCAERGFSFMKDGPLDMRMGPDATLSAADIVNEASVEELTRILWEYGEERASRRIARAICEDRQKKPFVSTLDLAGLLERILPRSGKQHPATRTFQALRIAVNGELSNLESALENAAQWLKPGGRFAVITFHSLEDRMVKRFFRERSQEWIDRPEWPAPRPNPDRVFRLVSRKAIAPTREEILANPRARSAKLRVVERLP